MIGRGLRTADGKTDCIVLDHAGAVYQHGLPQDEIAWTLSPDRKAENIDQRERAAKLGKDPFCDCPSCGAIRMRGMACDACGWEPARRGKGIDFADGELIELDSPSLIPSEADRITFYCELRGFAQTARKKDGSSYHPKWAACQYKDKHKSWPPWSWNDKPTLAPSPATLRWIKHKQIAWAKRRSAA